MHSYLVKLTLASGRKVVGKYFADSREAAIQRAEAKVTDRVVSYEASLLS